MTQIFINYGVPFIRQRPGHWQLARHWLFKGLVTDKRQNSQAPKGRARLLHVLAHTPD